MQVNFGSVVTEALEAKLLVQGVKGDRVNSLYSQEDVGIRGALPVANLKWNVFLSVLVTLMYINAHLKGRLCFDFGDDHMSLKK